MGSTFTVTVPRRFAVADSEEEMVDVVVEAGRIPVLLVEDDPADAHAIERILSTSI